MAADRLAPAIAHDRQEQVVGGQDMALKVEFDHRLRLVDRVQLAVRLAIGPATLGHVAADLQDHLDIALRVEDRRVAGLQPYRTAVAAHPAIGAAVELALPERPPEALIILCRHDIGWAEQTVLLTDHLFGTIAKCAREILVRPQHPLLQVEHRDEMCLIDRLEERIGPLPDTVSCGGVSGG